MPERFMMKPSSLVNLTSKEFDLLLLFLHHKGHPFSREDILLKIWGHDYFGTDRVVDDLVRRLRKNAWVKG